MRRCIIVVYVLFAVSCTAIKQNEKPSCIIMQDSIAEHLINKVLLDSDVLESLVFIYNINEDRLFRSDYYFHILTDYDCSESSFLIEQTHQEFLLEIADERIFMLEEGNTIDKGREFSKLESVPANFSLSYSEIINRNELQNNFSLGLEKRRDNTINIFHIYPRQTENAIYQQFYLSSLYGNSKMEITMTMNKETFELLHYSFGFL